jgi:hypothetical protein
MVRTVDRCERNRRMLSHMPFLFRQLLLSSSADSSEAALVIRAVWSSENLCNHPVSSFSHIFYLDRNLV